MSRSITGTMSAALANDHAVGPLARAEVFPSLVSFEALTRDNAVSGADTNPASDDPMRQDIIYNATAGLVTFYADGTLKYALDGDSSPVSTVESSSIKPGVYGNKLYVLVGSSIYRRSINWSQVTSKNTNPFSADATLSPSNTIVAIHGISETECVAIGDDDGGFSIAYFTGTTEIVCSSRFMFPSSIDWDGSDRTMESLGLFSTAFRLGNRIFVYISNASSGMVQGVFYDLDTQVWSDVFVALPTDLDVSLCEFRIANSFVRNNVGYMVGQLIRTDIYETDQPYTLILSTDDGRNFDISRFSFVANLGYRFLGTVGTDNNLYLGNCNRICQEPSTWVFDGDDDSTSPMTDIPMSDILSVEFNADDMTLTLKSGNEAVLENTHFSEGSRVKLYSGYKTSSGDEYIKFGTYIIDSQGLKFADGDRGYTARCVHEGQWKLQGLSMPFYAEILGLSSMYDPMTEESGDLYAAPNNNLTEEHFYIDFWNSEPYANASEGITGHDIMNTGVGTCNTTASHKVGFITKELSIVLSTSGNPKITGTTLNVKIYGWSRPNPSGLNDVVNLVLVTCDEDGKNEETVITADTKRWKTTYPTAVAGEDPITLAVSGMTVDRYIKKVGLVFEQTNGAISCPGRVEFVDNVEVPVSLSLSNTPWERTGEGTFKIPAAGQPFIMFSQKPYNAFNFFLTSLFENTVTGGISGYPVAVGLIGLAEDASNFIVARYDKVTDKAQLVLVRNGLETELANAAPGWSMGDLQGMQFSHQDGHFEIKMYNESTETYSTVLTYDWGAADGFMFTSRTVTRKCGIYGAIMAPSVKLIAYDGSSQEDTTTADGMPIDPLGDITDFPSSGDLYVEGNIYSYTGKISHPAYIPGPHQLRNTGKVNAPYGIGKPGVECYLFDWNGSTSAYNGKLIALDNGKNFISIGSQWHIYITTGGKKIWLRNRSRHYSENTQLVGASGTTATRVWPGLGGFSGVSLKSGTPRRIGRNSRAILSLDGEITCYWFMGSGGQHDTTVKDLIESTCAISGTKALFPGDFYDSQIDVNGSEVEFFNDAYGEGFDLEFDLSAPETFEIRTNVRIVPDNYDNSTEIESDTGTKLVCTDLGSGSFSISLVSTPSDTVMYTFVYSNGNAFQHYRILYYENNISVYHNYRWVASIALDELDYNQTGSVTVNGYSSSLVSFLDVYIRDLSDWREAIYIDLETDGAAAIGSIIQERPVEIVPNPDGSLSFFYDMTRPRVTMLYTPFTHEHNKSIPRDGASDAIVYGSDDVKTIVNADFANTFGFSTVLLRFPNLNVGAVEAAQRTQIKAFERKDEHTFTARIDFRIMPSDVIDYDYIISGTGRAVSGSAIVESANFSISQNGKKISANMTVKGRGEYGA